LHIIVIVEKVKVVLSNKRLSINKYEGPRK